MWSRRCTVFCTVNRNAAPAVSVQPRKMLLHSWPSAIFSAKILPVKREKMSEQENIYCRQQDKQFCSFCIYFVLSAVLSTYPVVISYFANIPASLPAFHVTLSLLA